MTVAANIILLLLLLNFATFGLFWADKVAARGGDRRIPEKRLLGFAMIGGSIGAVAAQHIFRHKTRKEPFRTRLMTIVMLHIVLLVAWLCRDWWYPVLEKMMDI